MNYFSVVLSCLILILLIASLMYILGRKISYNFILYNGPISLGVGVIFFLGKMIFFETKNTIESGADIAITLILLFVWLVALIETIVVAVIVKGNEIKTSIRNMQTQLKSWDIKTFKSLPNSAYRFGKELILKIKAIPLTFSVKDFLQKNYKKIKERF